MDMNIFKTLTEFGLSGAIIAVLFYDVFCLQRKLMTIIENNTKAMVELKEIILKKD